MFPIIPLLPTQPVLLSHLTKAETLRHIIPLLTMEPVLLSHLTKAGTLRHIIPLLTMEPVLLSAAKDLARRKVRDPGYAWPVPSLRSGGQAGGGGRDPDYA